MQERLTFLFSGGGTGGHLFPGIAVADELRARTGEPGASATGVLPLVPRILFTGSERPIERQIISDHGYEHRKLPVEPSTMLRRNPVKFLWRNGCAWRAAVQLLKREQPVAVIGLGGFASIPVVLAASRLRIPVLLLEQNTVAGRATRWLSRRADLVCLSFDQTAATLPKGTKTCVTGNPIRRSIAALAIRRSVDFQPAMCRDRSVGFRPARHVGSNTPIQHTAGALEAYPTSADDAARPVLLILGGSQGAIAVNNAALAAVEAIRESLHGWSIVHQTGAAQAEDVRRHYARLGMEHVVAPFFPDLTDWYCRADAVVSRSGATTLAELACAGCPAVLIPYPNSIGNHQLHTARVYESAGAAVIVEQNGTAAAGNALAGKLAPLLTDAPQRENMRQAMYSLAKPQAARAVVERLMSLLPKPQRDHLI